MKKLLLELPDEYNLVTVRHHYKRGWDVTVSRDLPIPGVGSASHEYEQCAVNAAIAACDENIRMTVVELAKAKERKLQQESVSLEELGL